MPTSTEVTVYADKPVEAIRPESADPVLSTLAMIERVASSPDVDIDKMERLLGMQRQILAMVAQNKCQAAMALAQAEMPPIPKETRNSATSSFYAQLNRVQELVTPVYTKHGFALSFGTAECPKPDHVRITCDVTHAAGHSFQRQIDFAVDNLGPKGAPTKTVIHGEASAVSYGQRYLTCLIFNVRLTGIDDDARRAQQAETKGPSRTAPVDINLKELARQLWNVLKPVRGPDHDWNAANQWMWDECVISDTEAAPNLSAATFKSAIAKATAKLQSK